MFYSIFLQHLTSHKVIFIFKQAGFQALSLQGSFRPYSDMRDILPILHACSQPLNSLMLLLISLSSNNYLSSLMFALKHQWFTNKSPHSYHVNKLFQINPWVYILQLPDVSCSSIRLLFESKFLECTQSGFRSR